MWKHSSLYVVMQPLHLNFTITTTKFQYVGEYAKETISPKLFTAVLEGILKNLNWEDKGINMNGRRLTHLRFADDIIVISSNQQYVQEMMADLNRAIKKVGLKMNLSKTKIMCN